MTTARQLIEQDQEEHWRAFPRYLCNSDYPELRELTMQEIARAAESAGFETTIDENVPDVSPTDIGPDNTIYTRVLQKRRLSVYPSTMAPRYDVLTIKGAYGKPTDAFLRNVSKIAAKKSLGESTNDDKFPRYTSTFALKAEVDDIVAAAKLAGYEVKVYRAVQNWRGELEDTSILSLTQSSDSYDAVIIKDACGKPMDQFRRALARIMARKGISESADDGDDDKFPYYAPTMEFGANIDDIVAAARSAGYEVEVHREVPNWHSRLEDTSIFNIPRPYVYNAVVIKDACGKPMAQFRRALARIKARKGISESADDVFPRNLPYDSHDLAPAGVHGAELDDIAAAARLAGYETKVYRKVRSWPSNPQDTSMFTLTWDGSNKRPPFSVVVIKDACGKPMAQFRRALARIKARKGISESADSDLANYDQRYLHLINYGIHDLSADDVVTAATSLGFDAYDLAGEGKIPESAHWSKDVVFIYNQREAVAVLLTNARGKDLRPLMRILSRLQTKRSLDR